MAFAELPDVLLARVLAFAAPRDLEATTIASKVVAQHILPRFPLWKALFCFRWAMLNFALDDADDFVDASEAPRAGEEGQQRPVPIEIDDNLRALFPSSCTESRVFQLLAHAVTPVPYYADTKATMRYRGGTWLDHTIVPLTERAKTRPGRRYKTTRPLDFAFAGGFLGGDRCVRANAPFQTTFHVQVYKVRVPDESDSSSPSTLKYKVGVTASGYFEITISRHERTGTRHRGSGSDMTAIGLCSQRFRLVDKQPGWNSSSFGYHGDDGHLFHGSGHGQPFGPSFDIGDTVGCGVRRSVHDQRSFVFFTNNGDLIPAGDRGIECDHEEWYPVVGLDSANVIHVNYGQEPFRHDGIVDELFGECCGMTSILANQLQWYAISESDMEDSSDEEMSEASDDDDVFSNGGDDSDDSGAGDHEDAHALLRHIMLGHGVDYDDDDDEQFMALGLVNSDGEVESDEESDEDDDESIEVDVQNAGSA